MNCIVRKVIAVTSRVCVAAFFAILFVPASNAMAMEKPRTIVLTDIGGDPDDEQSMVRLMVYSNEFDIKGLIATSRMGHGHDTKPQAIQNIVNAYGKVRNNLLLHKSGYPTAQYLLDQVKSGNPVPGINSIGSGKDTKGSDHIISVVDSDTRPVWIVIWGGSTDLGQALWRVKNTRSASASAAFQAKIRVYAIGDQDQVGTYITQNFPNVKYIHSNSTPGVSFSGVFRGMYQNESSSQELVKDKSLMTSTWVKTHVTQNHGPLGALYPLTAIQTPNFIQGPKEGDTPSMFYVLSKMLGLSDPEQPTWGGWGGRFERSGNEYLGNPDKHWSGSTDRLLGEKWTVARFRSDYQNDFQARMDWCVQSFKGANHHPIVVFNNDISGAVVNLNVVSGSVVALSAAGSTDPDGNSLSYYWYQYHEAGSYNGSVSIKNNSTRDANFVAPKVTSPQTIHVILKVSDNGTPKLVSYRRIIITVRPH